MSQRRLERRGQSKRAKKADNDNASQGVGLGTTQRIGENVLFIET